LTNKSFCPLPFLHLSTLPTGNVRLCCKAVDNHADDLNLNKSTIDKIWNSEYYKNIRKQMLNGIFPRDCKVCYKEETLGKRSMRVKELEIWKDSVELNSALETENDGYLNTNPIYLDLRMGNLCNLKCRTCDPISSSQIHKEGKQLENSPKFFINKMTEADEIKEWWKETKFKMNLDQILPNARLLWLSGGEPTLVTEGNNLIQKCVDDGLADKIVLRYVINLTNLSDKFISNYEKFKEANFHASIDGLYEVNDYLRYPSKFDVLVKNLDKLCNSGANHVCLINTVSNMNIYRLPDLITWLDQFNQGRMLPAKLNINPLNKPELFHTNILDNNIKEKICQKFETFITTEKNKKELNSLCKLMLTENINKLQLRKNFYNYINSVDKVRNQSFVDIFPELENFYEICKNG